MKNIFLIFNNVVLAQTTGDSSSSELPNPLSTDSIIKVIDNILNYLIYISVPILAIMILVGGFQILTARGVPDKIVSGKKTITYAVIGFTIVLVSKGIALVLLTIIG
ncbi:MAG: hypothetical protein ABIH10_01070 [Spirochaetota bacterium]